MPQKSEIAFFFGFPSPHFGCSRVIQPLCPNGEPKKLPHLGTKKISFSCQGSPLRNTLKGIFHQPNAGHFCSRVGNPGVMSPVCLDLGHL